MGLSLRNIAKKIGDVATGVERQVNPFDNGATYSNPTPPHPNGVPPSLLHQAGSFVNNQIAKPLAQFPIDAANQLYNRGIAPILGTPNLTPQQTTPIRTVANAVGATGSLHQTIGSGLMTGLTLASGGISDALEGGAAKVLPKFAAPVVNNLAPRVVSNAALGAGFNASSAAAQGANLPQTLKAGAVGTTAGLFPVAGVAASSGAKLALRAADNRVLLANEAGAIGKDVTKPPTEPVPPAEKSVAFTQPAPKGAVASGKVLKPTTSMPEVNAAISDVSKQYTQPVKYTGDLQDVVGQAQGQSSIGIRAANALRKALSNNLSKEENASVSDILDNHPGAHEAATPKAQEAAGALKALQDQGYNVRKAIDPSVNKVQDYVSRIPSKTVGAAVSAGTKVLGKVRSLSDITNLRSVFSQSRQIGKFVGKSGDTLYGNPSELGLVRHQDGTITDSAGNSYRQSAVSKRELEANGAGTYEHNISRISGIYHADTASLKVRAEALQHIKDNPEALGLSKVQEPGMVPISRVKELSDYFGDPKDVKALEDNFGFKNASGPIGKAYDAVSNVVTQFIVLNPFFHGMNQLYQTAIAAGNLPGKGNGWFRVAQGVHNVTEADVRDYLGAGGHIPTYGLNMENALSRMTHGATKLNNKAMSAIETRLRVGLYKASLEKGMAPKEAVTNIDKFLGDAHQIGVATRRFTLFFHYFKTMASALGSQIAHPVENAGANINAVTMAAITAAVTYGWQEATGNKNAYVRVPGELGLIKEGYESAKGIAKGDSRKAVGIITNRVNPVLKEGIQQAMPDGGVDLFTGKKVTETPQSIPGVPGGRVGHAVGSLIAPAQVASRVGAGSKSKPEVGLNQLGLYTPHAKGHQAAPNIPAINTKGAIAGNGVAEQNAYFDGLAQAQRAVNGDKKATAGLAYYLAKSHDPNTGQSIQNSPSESIQNSAMLTNNDKLRAAVQKFNQSQPSHDPIWDLSPDKLKLLMQYKEQFTGDAAKKFLLSKQDDVNGNNWITDVQKKEQAFYDNLPKLPGQPPIQVAPKYPTFDPPTTQLMTTYDAANPTQRAALIKQYGGELSTAWNQVAQWTNSMRRAEGAPELKDYPVADAATQKVMDYYNSLPKGDGPKGGSPERAAWIRANPGAYAKMQDYLTQASMNSLVKNAALDQFKGAEPNQTLLKDIANVGSHDIYKDPNTGQYALNPSAAYAAQSALNSSYASNSAARKDARYLSNAAKHRVGVKSAGGKIKGPSVKVKLTKAKFSVKSRGAPRASKVALKPSKV